MIVLVNDGHDSDKKIHEELIKRKQVKRSIKYLCFKKISLRVASNRIHN